MVKVMDIYKSNVVPEKDWRKVPGAEQYEVNAAGDITHVWKSYRRSLTPRMRQNPNAREATREIITLTMSNGKRREFSTMRLMLYAFGIECGDMVPVHINGVKTDHALRNIALMTRKELGEKYGKNARRRPVVKKDIYGKVVAYYPSVREAARENYMSYQTITDCIKRKNKKKTATDGYIYRYDR